MISEVAKGDRCDRNVARWFAALDDDDLYLSVLVLGEIRRGIELARPRQPERARALADWLDAARAAFEGRTLPVDQAVAEEWGRMSSVAPVPVVDGLLAATAKVNGLVLATRNVRDVSGTGARVVNPFEPRSV